MHKDVALRPQWQPFNVMDEYIVFKVRVHSSFPPFNPEACWVPPQYGTSLDSKPEHSNVTTVHRQTRAGHLHTEVDSIHLM